MSYNPDAIIFETQLVVSNNSQLAGSTTGSFVNEGTLSTKDTFITGQTIVNNVNITPNTSDIIYERQATLVNDRNNFTDIPDFTFDSGLTTSFKAIINVTVSTGQASHAVWEINGLYKPSGWVITSSFTGDITGVFFSMRNDAGIGKIQYTNSNSSGTTIIRFRATTTAPPGTTPEGVSDGVGVALTTTGNFIQNSLIYANGTNSFASTDITYNSNIFSIGGVSRIVAERATSFVNFSNGGAITSMGDASIAKNLIVGEKIGIATTSPEYTLDINGDLNFNGSLYQNGAAYKSSQWTSTGNDISYTTGSVLTTGLTTGNLNFTGDIYRNGVLYSGSAWITGTDGSLSYTSGSLISSTFNAQNAVFTNSSLGSATINDFVNLKTDNLNLGISNMYSGSFTANNNVSTPANITGLAFDNGVIRSFNATVTITVLKSTNQNLYESYTLDGFQTGSGWNLYTSHIGDDSGVSFSITNTGQVKYTSIDQSIDWISTILRFNVSTINNQEGYSRVDFNTAGTYTIAGITAGNINFTGALYQNGSPFLGTSQWNNTIGGGISFTSGNIVVRNLTTTNISSTSLNVTGITAGSINFTSDIYKNGVPYTGSQWLSTSGNISFTSGTVNATGIVASTMTIGSLKATTTISTGTLAATNAPITNITASTLRLSNGTISNLLITNVTGSNSTLGNVYASNVNSSNITVGTLNVSSINMTGGSVSGIGSISTGTLQAPNGITVGNINFTGSLYQNGVAYLGSQWTTTLGNVSYTSGSVVATDVNIVTLSAGTLVASNANATALTAGTLVASNANATALTAGTLVASNANATALTAGTLVASNANVVTLTAGTLVASNANATALTTGSVVATDVNVVTLTAGTLVSSNANVTALTAGSVVATDVNVVNLTAGNVSFGTMGSSLIKATVITAGTISLSGDLIVGGTLTTVNITTTNLTDTNISAGILNASSSTISNALFTNISSSSLIVSNIINTNLTSGSVNSTSVSSGLLAATNATATNLVSIAFSSGSVNATTIVGSTSVSSGLLAATNATVTNLVSTAFSSGSVNATTIVGSTSVSSGLLAATNATATNLVSTAFSSGSVNATTIVSTTLTTGTLFSNNIVSSSLNLTSTNGNYTLSITDGNVYFKNPLSGYIWYENNTASNMQLTNGNLTVTGDITGFGNLSDIRLKTNVIDIAQMESLRVVNALRPVTFDWKNDIFNESKRGTSDAGFIAQELEQVIPYAVSDYTISDTTYKNIKFERILPYLVGSIQKLTIENNDLKNRLNEIEKTL